MYTDNEVLNHWLDGIWDSRDPAYQDRIYQLITDCFYPLSLLFPWAR